MEQQKNKRAYLINEGDSSCRKPQKHANLAEAFENRCVQKMRILYLADCRSIHTQRYARFFKDRGHDVHIFDISGYTNNLEDIKLHYPQPARKDGTQVTFEDQIIHNVLALNTVINEIKPDILHGHYLSGWCWWGALTGFQPYISTCWGSDIFLDSKNNQFYRRFNEFCLRECRFVTAGSTQLFRDTASLRGSADGIAYILFGIDLGLFRPGYDTSQLAKRFGIDGSKVVLSSRQFKPEANIDVIIKAIPKVVDKVPDVVFILKNYLAQGLSVSKYESYLHELVKELNVEDHVIFMEDVDFSEMPVVYNLADVMVTLRDTDSATCSMLEAMACKTAVIASDIESMHEWIKDGVNGRIVDHHDPVAVAEAIIEILLCDEKSRKFENLSYALVHEKADYRKCWFEVEDLYYRATRDNQRLYIPGLIDANLAVIQKHFEDGWKLIASHKYNQAREAFLNILRIKSLSMQTYMKVLIGLAQSDWKKGNISGAKAQYNGCLRLLQNFELHTSIDIKI